MASTGDLAYLIFWFAFAAVLLYVIFWAARKFGPEARRRLKSDYGEPLEVDLRLTYKRFKELYPFSTITYQEYKKLQMERAFKRAVSSEKNKRMVR